MAVSVSIKKVKDPDLAAWLSQESGEAREILVEAVLPGRRVTFDRQAGGRARPVGLEEEPAALGRKETLSRLRALVARFLDVPPVVLEAAGALAVRARSEQVRQFVDHPLVKAVRPNRKLRAPVSRL